MTTIMRRLLEAMVLALGVTFAGAASADVELSFGVYAADQRVKMMWQCGRLVSVMEDRMSKTLKEPVSIEVGIDDSYDQGVEDVTQGRVDFARFPNVDHGWVIHPDVPEQVVLAWREAFVSMNFEYLPYMLSPDVFVEGDIGHCRELERLAERGSQLTAVQY